MMAAQIVHCIHFVATLKYCYSLAKIGLSLEEISAPSQMLSISPEWVLQSPASTFCD